MFQYLCWGVLALACKEVMGMGCSVDADGIGNCTTPDQTAMIQSRVRVHDHAAEEMFTYGPQEVSYTMLEFFKGWSKDAIESRLSRIVSDDGEDDGESHASMIQIETAALSASEAVGMLASLMNNECPEKDPALLEEAQYQVVQSGFSEDAGIRHVLLQDVVGRLQYMASHQLPNGDHQAMASDPPICSNVGSIATLETEGPGLSADPLGDGGKGSGGSNLLLLTDPLVTSCKELFQNTFVENCGGDKPNVTVLTAHRVIINGLKIHMRISVNGHPHHPDCTYETSTDHTDASLLESNDPPEATKGLVATLKLNVPLCDADDKDGGSDLTDSLLQQFSFGENSLYVGMEHVNDDIPVYSALEVEVPSSLDFRTEYSRCYPALPGMKPGTETVRNQGTCGSCWAFASATSTMANLCITDTANKHSFFKSGDRFEVSVQKIMSCKAKGQSTASGCKGGNMNGFGSEAATWGLTKERDNLYRCGGGNPKKHFQHTTSTCEAFPWAGECTGQANPAWWWGGAARVDGESSMQTFLASGQSMYISIKVYSNFMNVKGDSIYTYTSGSVEGGHAMNCLGYGTQSGTKYWIIQNSWGTRGWGDQGYCKFKRGSNLAGIEDGAYAPRVWVTGGKEPPCQDSKSGAGISSTGRAPYIPCNQAKSYCSRSGWPVAKNCPKTCGTCTGFNGAGKSSPPSPPPSPGPPPPAPPPPPPPAGKACCRGACQSTSQCASNLFCCPYHHMCMDSSTGSTAGPNCNKCKGNPPAPPPPPSPPGPSPPSPNGCSDLNPSGIRLYGKIATCGQLKRYCKGYSFVRKRCKLTCGQCGGGGGGGSGSPRRRRAAAKDDPNYKTPMGWTCPQSCKYLKYLSSSLQRTVKSKCKKSCGGAPAPAPAPTPAPTPAPAPPPPAPAPSAPPSPGPPSPGAKSADCGSEGFTQAEAQEMLDWHNKFRCAVGVPPIEWNGALQCQAQDTQNKIGKFSHSKSYDLDISAGENLATGTSVSMAAWMWFTEYTQADCSTGQGSKCGHFTAMVWKSTTHLGCGIQKDGGGVVRCQYAASPPNYAGEYTSNVPKFRGEESKLEKCGLTIEETKQKVEQFKGWGILHPIAPYDSSLGI